MSRIKFRKDGQRQERRWIRPAMAVAILGLIGAAVVYPLSHAHWDRYTDYRTRQDIHTVLQDKKMDRDHMYEIAEAITDQSRKTGIPVSMFLGLMQTESNFTVDAVSSRRAMGILQIHPVTWKEYAKKLNLPDSPVHAFQPSVNIMVSAAILRDLCDRYQRMGYQEPKLWDHVLSAYYAGKGSVRGGLKRHHRHYVKKVRTYSNEYGQKLKG
jgi:soluble lytic murein transglycosylase-like protein